MTISKPLDEDFESFDMMGVDCPDSDTHSDDMFVDNELISTHTEPCPKCGEPAAILFEVSVAHEFRQCLIGCGGIFRLFGTGGKEETRK
mgnify:CR=1 FL=1